MNKYFLVFLTSFQFFINSSLFSTSPSDFFLPYNSLLEKHVAKGSKENIELNLVSYADWKRDPLHKEAMELLQKSDPEALMGAEKIAFWINAYNLLTIELITSKNEKKSIKRLASWFRSPWSFYSWNIGKKSYTLDDIEHKILRKLGDARIHMAIVCASISCPDLRSEAYFAHSLDKQLSDQSVQFLKNSGKGLEIAEKQLRVSMIFKWFEEDFGNKEELLNFLIKYSPSSRIESTRLSYFDYNWNLNGNW